MTSDLLVLAYLGDAIYEVMVREYLMGLGKYKINDLKTMSLKFVSAKSQANILSLITDKLTLEEQDILRRGRNVKTNSKPKNCNLSDYKYATSFEVLFGYLYVKKDLERLKEIFSYVTLVVEV